jgi:GNAT superfamily N-acetyltransferase
VILIKRAGLEDMDAAAPLFDAYRQFYGQRSDLAAARAFLDERLRRGESVVFLAVADGPEGRAVGFMQLYPSFTSVSLGRLWILNDLYVDPGVRRGGVGRRLLERARDWAVETQAKGLVLSTGVTNKTAQSLYESCGWTRDDEFHHYRLPV